MVGLRTGGAEGLDDISPVNISHVRSLARRISWRLAASMPAVVVIAEHELRNGGTDMERTQWLIQTVLALAALIRLLVSGRRNGWI